MRIKNFILAIGAICLLFILTECEKETNNNSSDKIITYLKTESGGCNGQIFDDLKSVSYEQEDTIVFSINNDTLNVFVGVNYICCAPFTSEAIISNDSIFMNLTDTCLYPYQSCYCRCICYYTWDFLFVDFKEKEYYFKIILNDPREENPIILDEGFIDLSINN